MVSSVIELLMLASIVLLPLSLATPVHERRDQYGQSGH